MSPDIKKYSITVVIILTVGFGVFYSGLITKSYNIINRTGNALGIIESTDTKLCDPLTRPFAVMVSSDAEARPLSGISQADFVFEMPVTNNGVTRMMAVFQCDQPSEIGSIRSARLDFLPLVQGIGAIYAHWGGEHQALTQLENHLLDNINGLIYDGTIFYRKTTIPRPHNGFTSFDLMRGFAESHQYSLQPSIYPYLFDADTKQTGIESPPSVYHGQFAVTWQYNPQENSYARSRGDQNEIDKNTNTQVTAKNIIILNTTWSPISKDYIRVQTLGTGPATLYQNGTKITGYWTKQNAIDPIIFTDQNGKPFHFLKSPTWIEIDTGL